MDAPQLPLPPRQLSPAPLRSRAPLCAPALSAGCRANAAGAAALRDGAPGPRLYALSHRDSGSHERASVTVQVPAHALSDPKPGNSQRRDRRGPSSDRCTHAHRPATPPAAAGRQRQHGRVGGLGFPRPPTQKAGQRRPLPRLRVRRAISKRTRRGATGHAHSAPPKQPRGLPPSPAIATARGLGAEGGPRRPRPGGQAPLPGPAATAAGRRDRAAPAAWRRPSPRRSSSAPPSVTTVDCAPSGQ
jgi:hypothetical protein